MGFLSSVSCSRKLIKPNEGVVGNLRFIASQSETEVTTWTRSLVLRSCCLLVDYVLTCRTLRVLPAGLEGNPLNAHVEYWVQNPKCHHHRVWIIDLLCGYRKTIEMMSELLDRDWKTQTNFTVWWPYQGQLALEKFSWHQGRWVLMNCLAELPRRDVFLGQNSYTPLEETNPSSSF